MGILANFALAVLSGWLIWKILSDLCPGTKAAFWGVLFYCFEPVGFLYSEKLLTETLFTALLLLFILHLLRFLRGASYRNLALAAIELGAATYVRPVSLYLGLLLVSPLFLLMRQASWRKRVFNAILFPLIFGFTLMPWTIRNSRVADYRAFSSTGDWNLYFLSAAAVEAQTSHQSFARVMDKWGANDTAQYFFMHPEQQGWSQGRVARFWHDDAKRIIFTHLASYSLIHMKGCLIVVFDPATTETLKSFGLYPEKGGLLSRMQDEGILRGVLWLFRQYPAAAVIFPLLGGQLMAYYLLAIAGLRRFPFAAILFLVVVVAYFVVVSGFPAAVARYRAPIMPVISICAGTGISNWLTARNRRTLRTATQPDRFARV
jgi:hypothetical protein